MKVGTLTLHLPFNYGNALQQFSLHKYLLEQGCDAEVLSHWYFKNRAEVLGLHQKCKSLKGLVHFVLDCLTFSGVFCQYRRETKLDRWLKKNIRWSAEQGTDVDFPAERLSHDVVIVGSDQVWNPIYKTSDFFLLPAFGNSVKRIAYAASFGTSEFISDRRALFSAALRKFLAISVRESSAVSICKDELGVNATLVCDPTLLHTREEWCKLLGFKPRKKTRDELVVYLVTPDYRVHWREIFNVARGSGKKVHCFAFQWSQGMLTFNVRRPFSMLCGSMRMIAKRALLYLAGVRLHFSATPAEFVRRIAESDGLITDSFHGMMFATIFGKKCNVIVGEHAERQQMSARLRDFTKSFGVPGIITPRIDLEAMRPLSINAELQHLIDFSKVWIEEALNV